MSPAFGPAREANPSQWNHSFGHSSLMRFPRDGFITRSWMNLGTLTLEACRWMKSTWRSVTRLTQRGLIRMSSHGREDFGISGDCTACTRDSGFGYTFNFLAATSHFSDELLIIGSGSRLTVNKHSVVFE